jgi:AraC family transcriptional regulator
MGAVDRSLFKYRVVNPPRDSARCNFVMGGPDGPNLHHRGPEPYAVAGLQGWLSIKTVRKGCGVWVTPDGRHQLDEGFAVILNDGQAYDFELSADEPVETFCAFFKPGFVQEAARTASLGDDALLDNPRPDSGDAIEFAERIHPTESAVRRRLEPLYDLTLGGDIEPLAWDEAFADLAVALLSTRETLRNGLAARSARASTRAEITRRLGRALDYIHDNASSAVDLADIAAAAALSPYHFHRLFKLALNRTPHRYVSELRLQRATRLLARTDLPVTEVCLMVGFSSLGSFSTLFTRTYGLAPSAWRAKTQDSRSAVSRAG